MATAAALLVWGVALLVAVDRQRVDTRLGDHGTEGSREVAAGGLATPKIPTQIPRGIIVGWDCPPKKAGAAGQESGDEGEGEGDAEPKVVDPCPPPDGWARSELPKVFWRFGTDQDSMVDGLVVCTKDEDPPEVNGATFTRLEVRRVGTAWQPTDASKKLVWMRWKAAVSDASKLHPGMLVGWLVSAECFEQLPGQLEIPAPRHWFIKE